MRNAPPGASVTFRQSQDDGGHISDPVPNNIQSGPPRF